MTKMCTPPEPKSILFTKSGGKTPKNQKKTQPRFGSNFQIKLKPTQKHQANINDELNS